MARKTGPTEGGSHQVDKPRKDGWHQTAYNPEARVHFSQDVSKDGKVTNRHWTDHETGRKVGERDKGKGKTR